MHKQNVFVVTKEMQWWESGNTVETEIFQSWTEARLYVAKVIDNEVNFFLNTYNEINISKTLKKDFAKYVITGEQSYTILKIEKKEVK